MSPLLLTITNRKWGRGGGREGRVQLYSTLCVSQACTHPLEQGSPCPCVSLRFPCGSNSGQCTTPLTHQPRLKKETDLPSKLSTQSLVMHWWRWWCWRDGNGWIQEWEMALYIFISQRRLQKCVKIWRTNPAEELRRDCALQLILVDNETFRHILPDDDDK